jgi:HK97 family phage major capsid protein
MTLKEQIEAARKKRAEQLTALEALVTKSESEDRSLTDDEQATFDGIKTEIKSLDERLTRLTDTEALIRDNAKTVVPDDNNDVTKSGLIIKVDSKRPKVKGAFFAKQAHFLFLAQGNTHVAAELAERAGDKEMGAVLRAAAAGATSTTSGWATELVDTEIQDFIELLRPMSIFSRMPAGSTVSFDNTNSIKLPKMSTGTPGGFVAEGGAIPVKAGAFTSVTLTPSKLGVITVATKEILARSSPALEQILRDSMLRDTAITLDRRFLCATAAGSGAPSGLFHTDNAPAAITASNLSNAADDAIADIKAMQQAMYSANVPGANLVWLMHPSKKLDLMNLRAATGSFYFRDELKGGTLDGIPVMDSSVFDKGVNDGSTTNIRTVALVDASLLVKGQGIAPTLALSSEATLHMDDAPNADILVPSSGGRSLFQTDSVGLRLTWETTWRMRHTVGVQYINNVNW